MPEEKKTEGTWKQPLYNNSISLQKIFQCPWIQEYRTCSRKATTAPPTTPSDPAAGAPQQQNLTPAVPPGWTAQWDPHNNHWTYHEQSTGRTQPEHPDPANYGGQSMPPGGPVLEKDGKPKKDKNGMLIGAAGGLATGAFGKKLMGHAKKKAMKQAGWFFFIFFFFWA